MQATKNALIIFERRACLVEYYSTLSAATARLPKPSTHSGALRRCVHSECATHWVRSWTSSPSTHSHSPPIAPINKPQRPNCVHTLRVSPSNVVEVVERTRGTLQGTLQGTSQDAWHITGRIARPVPPGR